MGGRRRVVMWRGTVVAFLKISRTSSLPTRLRCAAPPFEDGASSRDGERSGGACARAGAPRCCRCSTRQSSRSTRPPPRRDSRASRSAPTTSRRACRAGSRGSTRRRRPRRTRTTAGAPNNHKHNNNVCNRASERASEWVASCRRWRGARPRCPLFRSSPFQDLRHARCGRSSRPPRPFARERARPPPRARAARLRRGRASGSAGMVTCGRGGGLSHTPGPPCETAPPSHPTHPPHVQRTSIVGRRL